MKRKKINKDTDNFEALKKDVISTISHKIRTPLTIVKEGLCLLEDEIPGQLNSKQKKVVAGAEKSVDRLIRSIEKILKTRWDNILDPAFRCRRRKKRRFK